MSYHLVSELQKKAIPVKQSCGILGVSRSGFYKAKQGHTEPKICPTTIHLRATFADSHQSYGSRRLVAAMAAKGIKIGRYRVRTLMREANLKSVWKRKFVNTTNSNHDLPIAKNVLARRFNPSAPDLAYVSDITYIRTRTGWLCLQHEWQG
jgi:putative transposase